MRIIITPVAAHVYAVVWSLDVTCVVPRNPGSHIVSLAVQTA